MIQEETVTELWKLYQKGLNYQNSIGLRDKIPQHVRFFQGDQWPAPTENTKNLPRPVINIIKMICRNKKSAILSSPVRIIYKSANINANMDNVNKFSEHIFKELGQDKLDKEAIDDAVKKGSYFYHYYWDAESTGVNGQYEGALRAEIIDPLNIFFENPCQLDEQKQGWVLISSRENVETLRAIADKSNRDLIVADNYEYNAYNQKEQDENGLCTVLTRYFRRNGEVFCEKATKKCIIKEAFPITPDIEKAKKEIKKVEFGIEDVPNNDFADDVSVDNNIPKAKLYPIVAGYYEKREGCIYGLSEVEGLIPNQKAINFNIAMSLLNTQEIAWGKYIAVPGALKGQKISNVPGQVLIDHTGTGNGIKRMPETSIHTLPVDLAERLISQTRNVVGATELLSGEVISANMSGAAIAQLQAQAQMPVEDLRNLFWEIKKKQGLVVAQFLQSFYFEQKFSYDEEDETTKEKVKKQAVFSSKDYFNIKFEVIAEATQGTRSSVAADINMLDNLLTKGIIDAEMYIRLFPDSALGNKSDLLNVINSQKENKLKIAEQTIAEQNALIEQLQGIAKAIYPTIKENDQLNASNAELSGKYTELANEYGQLMLKFEALAAEAKLKIKEANEQIAIQNQEIETLKGDATFFAGELLNNTDEVNSN